MRQSAESNWPDKPSPCPTQKDTFSGQRSTCYVVLVPVTTFNNCLSEPSNELDALILLDAAYAAISVSKQTFTEWLPAPRFKFYSYGETRQRPAESVC